VIRELPENAELVVEWRPVQGTGSFIVTIAGAELPHHFVCGLSFRHLQALIAVRAGMARMRERRRTSPWCSHYWLEADIDVYGIGFGTLWTLQDHLGLITKPDEEGPIELTPKGERVLDAILNLPGLTLPPLVDERTAVAA
jgi:hypothetical protein